MLKLNISYIIKLRGIKNPYSFLKKLGFSHYVAHSLANHKAEGLKLYQMEKLCQALYCTPNDLLEWDDIDSETELDEDHPLNTLKRNKEYLESMELLQKLPIEKMDELRDMLDDLIKE